MHRSVRVLICFFCCLILSWSLSGCGPKKSKGLSESELEKEAERLRKEQDAWMQGGRYWSDNIALQEKIRTAVDNFEKLKAYELGLYSDDYRTLLEYDGQVYGQDCYFQYHENKREPAWVFYVIKDRFYALNTSGEGLVDYGPNSAEKGMNFYRPLLTDIRVAVKQALKGEIRDMGRVEYLNQTVHRYDTRVTLPDPQRTLLTATVDVDETRNVLIHAVVGQGTGSETSRARFEKGYQEIVVGKVDEVGPIALPEEAVIIPLEREEMDWRKPVLH